MPFFRKRGSQFESPGSPGSKNVTFADSPESGYNDNGSFPSSPVEREKVEKDTAAAARVLQSTRDKDRLKLLQRHLLQIPKNMYLSRKDLAVAVCTWNVAEADPTRVLGLEKWLQAKRKADVIAVGLQEVDMSARSLATSSTGKSDPWLDCLMRHLIQYSFRKVTSQSLVGTLIVVFAKVHLVNKIEHLTVKEVKLGTGGFTGNKGALAVSFILHCKRFVFINSHFVPHTENTGKRNENFHFVLNYLTQHAEKIKTTSADVCCDLVAFGKSGEMNTTRNTDAGHGVDKGIFGSPKAGQQATVSNSLLGTTDYVFWFGDLNYRVEADYEEVMQSIAQKKVDRILKHDQLTKEMNAGRVFSDFREPPVTFLPTYKYLKGESIYDTSKKGGKPRVPAYTDRVLSYKLSTSKTDDFLPVESNVITATKYKPYMHTASDHIPVCCLYHVAVYPTDPQAVDCIIDLGGTGMSPAQITQALSEFTGRVPDEQSLFRSIPVPLETQTGEGTCYSSDEDQETVEQKQRTKLEDRLAALEDLLKAGPLPGDAMLGDIKVGQAGLQMRVEDLTSRLGSLPVVPNDEINLLGESMTHVLDRLQSVEELLLHDTREPGGDTTSALAIGSQFGDLTKRMDVFAAAVAAGTSGASIADSIPEHYRDSDSLADAERRQRAELRDAFLAGAALGSRYSAPQTGESGQAAAAAFALEEERDKYFRRREADLQEAIRSREAECERRERAVEAREAEINSRSSALEQLQHVLDDKIRAAGSLQCAESTALSALQRREEDIKGQELRLLQERAKLSSQELRLKQELADLEGNKEAFSSQLHQREQVIARRELHMDTAEESYRNTYEPHPSPTYDIRSVTPPQRPNWKGVLEGPTPSQSPARLRGAYQGSGNDLAAAAAAAAANNATRSRSPLSDLLMLHNLHEPADLSPQVPDSLRRSPSPPAASPGYRYSDPQPAQSHPQLERPRRTTAVKRPPPDKLHTALLQYAHDARLPSNFSRISPDPRYMDGGYVYAFGTRKVTLKMMGESRKEPRVLIASGWMAFSDFVSKFGDAEQRRLERSKQF